jgi:hypothetical protein
MTRTQLLVLFVVLLLIAPVQAVAYSVDVNKVTDFAHSFSTLAILPASCPTGVDCLWVESLIAEKLAERTITVIPASRVRQTMFDLEIKTVTPESRALLAEKLAVDAFVVIAIDSMATEAGATTGVVIGNVFTAVPSKKNIGSVQLAIISAATGKALMEGTGYGESSARPKRGVIGKTFNLILDKTFTRDFFDARRVK